MHVPQHGHLHALPLRCHERIIRVFRFHAPGFVHSLRLPPFRMYI